MMQLVRNSLKNALLLAMVLWTYSTLAAAAEDFSPIHGYWQGTHTACGTFSDDYVDINVNGAQFFESTCTLTSATKEAENVYTLKQQCEGFEEETWETSNRFTLTAADSLDIDGQPMRRCERP